MKSVLTQKLVIMPRSRQLAAIMFTDIQGYTALMQQNEDSAIAIREKHRCIFNSTTEKHKGKILQYYGDGTLSIFDSAIDAVHCGIEMQLGFQQADLPVRIGIHTGDIIFSDEEIIGDGVNVASRIESLAMPGSVFVSDKVYDEIKNQESIETSLLQTFKLKNVEKPITVYAISNVGLIVPKRADIEGKTEKTGPSDQAEKSIAVLPFVNMSSDPEQEYFSDGITEEIINALCQIEGLKVTGRTSCFSFKGKDEKLSKIGKKLHVKTIMEGSVRKAGNRLRITIQLINVANEYHIWSETYDRELHDIFALQDEISTKVAERMKITLAGDQDAGLAQKPTTSLEAYEMLLKGRYFRQQGVEGFDKAKECFQKAIDLDRDYAQAYGELAILYSLLCIHKFIPTEQGFNQMVALSNEALSLDPSIPNSHIGLASYYFWYAWDWENALIEYEKELELGAPTTMFYPEYLAYLYGDFEKAITEAKSIVASDPLNINLLRPFAKICSLAQRQDDARTILHKILELNPQDSEAHRLQGESHLYDGNIKQSLIEFRKAEEISQGKGFALTDMIIALVLSGEKKEAERLFTDLRKRYDSNTAFAFEIGYIYHCFGENDKLFEWLERAYENQEFWLVSLKVDPAWDDVREDPRFQQLYNKMNFPK
ncbi:MAG: guanylate cyclase [Saprospiraceae bacterium]|nr:guanylate cyclase [Saprospiraceae bacterium]